MLGLHYEKSRKECALINCAHSSTQPRPRAGLFISRAPMLTPQFILDLSAKLVIDLFAGGGGASTGIEQAIGGHVDVAVNHDADAIGMHEVNHPQTRHFRTDIRDADPSRSRAARRWACCMPRPTVPTTARRWAASRAARKSARRPGWCTAGPARPGPMS